MRQHVALLLFRFMRRKNLQAPLLMKVVLNGWAEKGSTKFKSDTWSIFMDLVRNF
jgi:hypothetical protein